MPDADVVGLARFGELLTGILPDRLQQPVPHLWLLLEDADHRLVHQPAEQLEQLDGGTGDRLGRYGSDDGLDRGQRECPGEHGQAAKDHLLGSGEQGVAPLHGGLERLVAGDGGPGPTGQQAEPVVEAFGHLVGAEYANLACRQLQPQGNTVQAPADPRHRCGIGVAEPEAGLGRPGPFAKQRDGVGTGEFRYAGDLIGGHGQRRDVPDHLSGQAENLPACGEHRDVQASGEQGVSEPSSGLDEVLAVVEDEQQPASPQMVTEAFVRRPSRSHERTGEETEGGDDLVGDEVGVTDGREFDEPGAVRKSSQDFCCRLERQPRLAHPPGAHQGQKAGRREE